MKPSILIIIVALFAASCQTEQLQPSLAITPDITEITLDENYNSPQPLTFQLQTNCKPVHAVFSQKWCSFSENRYGIVESEEGWIISGSGFSLEFADRSILEQAKGVSYAMVRIYCGDFVEKQIKINLPGEKRDLEITGFSPKTVQAGDLVTLTGCFATIAQAHSVSINGVNAEVVSVSDDASRLGIRIPAKAGSGKIRVMLGNDAAESETAIDYQPSYVASIFYETNYNNAFGSIAIDSKGNLFAIETSNYKTYLVKITPGGELTTIAQISYNNTRAFLDIDDNDNVYVLNDDGDHITKYPPSGSSQFVWSGNFDDFPFYYLPAFFCVDGKGNSYFSGIGKITPTGDYSLHYEVQGNYNPYLNGMTVDKSGNLFFMTTLWNDQQGGSYRTELQKLSSTKVQETLYSVPYKYNMKYHMDADYNGNVFYTHDGLDDYPSAIYKNSEKLSIPSHALLNPNELLGGDIAVDATGNHIYVVNLGCYIIRFSWE